jgi:Predicted glycosyl hydrolase
MFVFPPPGISSATREGRRAPVCWSLRLAVGSIVALVLCIATESAPAFTSRNADTMLKDFLSAFLIENGNLAHWRRKTGQPEQEWFWTTAEMIEMVEDAHDRTGSSATADTIRKLVDGFIAKHGSDWAWNEYNDDIMWAVSAFVRAYHITGNQNYLTIARSNFDMCYARAWNTDGNGGMRWKQTGTSKNAIAQSTAAIAAYRLFLATGERSYRATASRIYNWQKANQVYANGHVRDNPPGNNDPTTYNQGMFIGIANYLNDVEWATKAMDYLRTMGSPTPTSEGENILLDYPVDNDLAGFNGIAYRWAAKFMLDRGLEEKYLAWLRANANQALRVRNSAGLTWSRMHQQTPDEPMISWACSNAVVALNVVPPEDPDRKAVKVKSPKTVRIETRKAKYLVKGTARKTVSTVYLQNKSAAKKKLIEAKGVATWKAKVPLRMGLNRINVLADTGGKKPGRITTIRIVRVR